ncbi:MAG: STAS domain-containing protein [Candidatus Poribacteria bacterium]|nr:STAS domain-containing protein [Candidatus Poribacteria bacterium]
MANGFNVDVHTEDGYVVIQTAGYLNDPTGEALAEAAKEVMADGYNKIVIDLEKTRLINSIGISILIEIIELLEEQGGVLNFCNLTPVQDRIFKMMGLAQHAGIFPDQDSAIANL